MFTIQHLGTVIGKYFCLGVPDCFYSVPRDVGRPGRDQEALGLRFHKPRAQGTYLHVSFVSRVTDAG
jgi:hypothetical protein